MNIVMLSPHFPPNYDLFSVHLKNLGATVLGIGDAPSGELTPRLREALTEYCWVDDMHMEDQVKNALGYFIDRFGAVDRLESHNDHWLDMDARLREAFSIPGLKPGELLCMRRKSLMKDYFTRAGVRTSRWKIASTLEEATAWAKRVGYPIVAKPDSGVGASDTFKISNADELESFFSVKPEGDFIMEEFISGVIYTFDGLTDSDGRIIFRSSLRYNMGMMEQVNDQLDVMFYTLREIPGDLEEAGREVIRTFNIRERFFHLEFFRTLDKGDLVALEINARSPGGPILDIYNHASETDIYLKWARIITGNPVEPGEVKKPWHCAFVGRRDIRPHIYSHSDIMERFGHTVIHHEPVPRVFSSGMGDYYYILRSGDLGPLKEATDLLMACTG